MRRWLLAMVASVFCNTLALAAFDINTATQQQLETLNGIGPGKAKAIVDYRARYGPFKNLNDLDKVAGIGEKPLAKIKGELTIGVVSPLVAVPTKPVAPLVGARPVPTSRK